MPCFLCYIVKSTWKQDLWKIYKINIYKNGIILNGNYNYRIWKGIQLIKTFKYF